VWAYQLEKPRVAELLFRLVLIQAVFEQPEGVSCLRVLEFFPPSSSQDFDHGLADNERRGLREDV